MKFRYALCAGALCLPALASALVVTDPAMTIEITHARLNAEMAKQMPRHEVMSGAKVTINEAMLSSAGHGRLNVTLLADVDLSGMVGSVAVTTSGTPDYKELQIFFSDPKIENLEYEFPGMNVSSRDDTGSGANAFVTYMLPSLTGSALGRLQDRSVGTVPQDTWKQRALAAVLSDVGVSDAGLRVVLNPARLLPHALNSRNTNVVMGIIILCCLIINGIRSTTGSALGNSRTTRQRRS